MKLKIALGIVALIIVLGIALLTMPRSTTTTTEKTTSVSTSTSTTASTNEDTIEKTKDIKPTDKTVVAKSSTSYKTFESETFKNTKGTRVLFFYSDSSPASVSLNVALSNDQITLDKDVVIFRAGYEDYKQLADNLGVTKAGTLLKFSDTTQINGIYVLADNTDPASIKTALGI